MARNVRMDKQERIDSGMISGVCVDFKSKVLRYRAYLSLPKRGKALLYYGPDLNEANLIAAEGQRLHWYPWRYIQARRAKLEADLQKLNEIEKEYYNKRDEAATLAESAR